MSESVVIVNGARTAMGGFQGSLSSVTAPELGAVVIREAVQRAGLQPQDIQEVIMGCVLPAGLKQGPARQAMRKAGRTLFTYSLSYLFIIFLALISDRATSMLGWF